MVHMCCGKKMNVVVETTKFVEVQCDNCNDVVYVKKTDAEKPVLLDD